MEIFWTVLGIIILMVVVIWLIVVYNRFIPYRNSIAEAWGNLNALLNKRYSILPNFIEFVKGYMGHEHQVLREVIEARSMAMKTKDPTKKAKHDAALSNNVVKIFGLTENYPDLKADQRFQALEEQLVKLEEDIYYGRNYYNAMVKNYRNIRDRFPTRIAAWILRFRRASYFDTSDHKKEEVKANLERFYA